MKKLFATSFILLNSVFAIYAQWNGTNPIYTNSEVGINTSTTKGTGLTIGNGDSQAFISPGGTDTHLTLSTIGSNGAIRFYTQGGASGSRATTESMRISPLGNVGIGTISPGEKLDVMGNIRFSGGFFIFNTQQSFINWGGSGAGDLTFRTLNTIGNTSSFNDKMIIKYDGKVGIGTTTPGEKLDIMGNIRFNGGHLVYNSQHGVIDWGSSGTGDLYFRTLNTVGNISTYNDKMIIKNDGNVGIGTTAPSEKLHVNGAIRGNINGALRINTGYGYLDLGPQSSDMAHINTDRNIFLFNKSIYSTSGEFSSISNSKIYLSTNGTKRLTISENGDASFSNNVSVPFNYYIGFGPLLPDLPRLLFHHNGTHGYIDYMDNLHFRANKNWISALTLYGNGSVGIGFTTTYNTGDYRNQNYKLAVNGGILCEEVKVIVDVPDADYVFDKDYKLSSLAEIEAFINLHKHLPNIPSAETFKNEGYKIGEMDEMLLRKIEELTLYAIELNKKILMLEEKLKNN